MKNGAIRNCCISARGAMKLQPFGTSAEQSEARMSKWCNFNPPQAIIQQLYLLLNYRAIFDTSAKRS